MRCLIPPDCSDSRTFSPFTHSQAEEPLHRYPKIDKAALGFYLPSIQPTGLRNIFASLEFSVETEYAGHENMRRSYPINLINIPGRYFCFYLHLERVAVRCKQGWLAQGLIRGKD